MSGRRRSVLRHARLVPALWACVVLPGPATAQEAAFSAVVAELQPIRRVYHAGQPVWVDFRLRNESARVVTLTVPNVQASQDKPGVMGLPLEHVFSGPNFTALQIATNVSPHIGRLVSYAPASRVPAIQIGPFGSVGVRIDLAGHYHIFRQPGIYQVTWTPYSEKLRSQPVEIRITAMKQAVLETSHGNIDVRFFYEHAPNHVENFLELAKSGFYNGKTFHRMIPETLIQGGCPRGDGTGIRPDGKTLRAEFSSLPHKAGTLSMARKPNDPDSASCQFFFCLTGIPEFDGKQTVFGEAVGEESMKTLRRLAAAKPRKKDPPASRPRILRVTIVDAPATMTPSKAQTDATESPRLAGDH